MTYIQPDWPAPPNVVAVATTRSGGVSLGPYATLNLGSHVGDDARAVAENRKRVREALRLSCEPTWLNQVHGTNVVEAGTSIQIPTADASVAFSPGRVCVVLTADCLPIVFCDDSGTRVAVAHAGWRGLVGGVVSATVQTLAIPPDRLIAWLGPAIEQSAFEVGDEVRQQFIERDPTHVSAFDKNHRQRWQADIYALARGELRGQGVHKVYGGGFRTFADTELFFSYRRDGTTGRMGTMVWLERESG
jgi:polyphenol oxidase